MPISETAGSQQLKKEKMKNLLQTTELNEEEMKALMKSTFECLRKQEQGCLTDCHKTTSFESTEKWLLGGCERHDPSTSVLF